MFGGKELSKNGKKYVNIAEAPDLPKAKQLVKKYKNDKQRLKEYLNLPKESTLTDLDFDIEKMGRGFGPSKYGVYLHYKQKDSGSGLGLKDEELDDDVLDLGEMEFF